MDRLMMSNYVRFFSAEESSPTEKNRKNNKGFTLVELIIVVAIVAVLTAVLAPQYVKYVEKSRIARDMHNAATIEAAVAVLCADGMVSGADADYVTWDISTGLVGDGKVEVEAITGPIPAAVSEKAKATGNIVYSVDFNATDTPVVAASVDYTTWDD